MNDSIDDELRELRLDQQRLSGELASLGRRISVLEAGRPAEIRAPAPAAPPPLPSASFRRAAAPAPAAAEISATATAPVLAAAVVEMPPLPATPATEPAGSVVAVSSDLVATPTPGLPLEIPPGPPAAPSESFEMRLGGYWFVRIGVGALALALIYFAIYLYQTVTPRLGPGGKVALLYLASGTLLGLAWKLRRGANLTERLRNFAAVVESGGLGAVYFTTLAAHQFEPLRVIGSPALTLALLIGWGGLCLWLADRRESPTLATGAVLFAGAATALMPGSGIALGSSVIFSALAMLQWWRRGWIAPSFAAVLGAYGSYVFWRYGVERNVLPESGGFAPETLLLSAYWVVFAAGAFAPMIQRAGLRACFITLNNALAYALIARLVTDSHPDWLWRFTGLAGTLLLGLAYLAHSRLEGSATTAYRLQGLGFVTLAIVLYFSGWQLGLSLILWAMALNAAASWRSSRVLLVCALVIGVLGSIAIAEPQRAEFRGPLVAAVFATGVLFAGAWTCLRRPAAGAERAHDAWFRFGAEAWCVLAVVLGWHLVSVHVPTSPQPGAFAAFGAGLLVVVRFVPTRVLGPLAVLSHGGALLAWFIQDGALHLATSSVPPSAEWMPAVFCAFGALQYLTWRAAALGESTPSAATLLHGAAAGALALAVGAWPKHFVAWETWQFLAPLLAAALLTLGVRLRDRDLGAASQGLLIAGLAVAAYKLASGVGLALWPSLALALSPAVMAGFARTLTQRWDESAAAEWRALFQLHELGSIALAFAWAGLVVPPEWRGAAFSGVAVAGAGLSRWRKRGDLAGAALLASALAIGLVLFDLASANASSWLNGLALLAAAAATEILRTGESLSSGVQSLVAGTRGALAFAGLLWLTARMRVYTTGALFTAVAWSGYSLVLIGLGLWRRDRVVRLSGLAVLALTLLRVLVYEAWGRGPLYRMLSFLALGAVMTGLGYVYNRYQSKLREWL